MLRVAGREEEGQKVTDTKKMRGIRQETRLRSGYIKKRMAEEKGRRDTEILRRQGERALGQSTNWKPRRQVRDKKKIPIIKLEPVILLQGQQFSHRADNPHT